MALRAGAVLAAESLVVVPYALALSVVLYFDVRVRKEGFDVELLAQDMSGAAAQTAEAEGPR